MRMPSNSNNSNGRTPDGCMVRSVVQHRVRARYSLPVEWGLVVLDVPGLQHAVSLCVVVGINHHGLR